MLDLAAAFRRDRPPMPALVRLMRRALQHFAADRGMLVLRDQETGRHVTWSAMRRDGRLRVGLRLTDADPLPLSFLAATEAFIANDLHAGARTALCYDVVSGAITRRPTPETFPVPDLPQACAIMGSPVLIQRERRGYAVVVRDGRRKFTRADLEFLALLVGQAAAGFENLRLQQKAEEVVVLEERARIARDLHDGFIQSLAGIDLRVEACKLLLQRDPPQVPRKLDELQQAVARGYREVRQYLNVLRTPRGPVDDLWASLDRLAAEFSARERLRVQVARPRADPCLPSATAHELAQIVREALQNAVRHGRATQAVVKVATRPSHTYLVVRDNGIGFLNGNGSIDADGFLSFGSTPWSIRERAAAVGGALRVWTRPGEGTEISIVIPAGVRGGRPTSDRRTQA
jgi:signal transduction histidine kinase